MALCAAGLAGIGSLRHRTAWCQEKKRVGNMIENPVIYPSVEPPADNHAESGTTGKSIAEIFKLAGDSRFSSRKSGAFNRSITMK